MKLTNREWLIPNASAWRSFQWNEKLNRMITWVIISSWLPIGKKPWIHYWDLNWVFFGPEVLHFSMQHGDIWKTLKPFWPWHSHPWRGVERGRSVVLRIPGNSDLLAPSKLLVKSCEMNMFLAGLNKLYQHLIWVWTYCYLWLVISSWLPWKSVSLIWKQLSSHHSSITCWDLLLPLGVAIYSGKWILNGGHQWSHQWGIWSHQKHMYEWKMIINIQ